MPTHFFMTIPAFRSFQTGKSKTRPLAISHIVELICRALQNRIEAQRRGMRPPLKWDTDGKVAAEISPSLKQHAVEQLETALRGTRPRWRATAAVKQTDAAFESRFPVG